MKTLSRTLLCLSGLAFLGLALACWVNPTETAARLGLEAAGETGLATLRADLGGLFLGLGTLCVLGGWLARRAALVGAAILLAAIVLGRVVGWLAGEGAVGAGALAIELGLLLLIASVARRAPAAARGNEERLPRGVRVALPLIALFGLGSAATLLVPGVQQAIFDRAAAARAGSVNLAPFEDDALRVAVAGSSAPLPSAKRAKACVVVFAGGKFWVVDTGPESVENLVLWGIPLSRIGGVLLTHFHSDHIGDLGELQLQTWAGGRPGRLPVYGGPGVAGVVDGFNRAYQLDQGYRTAHHGEDVMPSQAWGMDAVQVDLDGSPTEAKDRTALVYDDGALRITAIEVDHAPIAPAYAYRFDYKGRSAVVTGDLKDHQPLAQSARNADLLVSEATSRSMTRSLEHAAHEVGRSTTEAIMHDVQDYHIAPEEAARIANEAHVRHLAFYHLLPAPDGWLTRRLFANGVNEVRRSGWTIADDGSLYTLPLGSEAVRVGRIDG